MNTRTVVYAEKFVCAVTIEWINIVTLSKRLEMTVSPPVGIVGRGAVCERDIHPHEKQTHRGINKRLEGNIQGQACCKGCDGQLLEVHPIHVCVRKKRGTWLYISMIQSANRVHDPAESLWPLPSSSASIPAKCYEL